MKNKVIVFIIVGIILVIAGGVGIMLFNASETSKVREFDLAKYQWALDIFPSDKNVGEVQDKNIAIEKAKVLWIEKYGIINGKPYDPTRGLKVNVSYNTENQCWHIYGTLPPDVDGGVPHALIQKDGKVLAVWCDD